MRWWWRRRRWKILCSKREAEDGERGDRVRVRVEWNTLLDLQQEICGRTWTHEPQGDHACGCVRGEDGG